MIWLLIAYLFVGFWYASAVLAQADRDGVPAQARASVAVFSVVAWLPVWAWALLEALLEFHRGEPLDASDDPTYPEDCR